MSTLEQDYTQPLGLDVGTSRVVVARPTDKKQDIVVPDYDSQLNAFLTFPYSKLAESLLQQENVFHEVQGADIVVAGNDAEKFAEVFHVEMRRPMANGVLNPEEPYSLAVVRRIVTKLVGRAAVKGQKVFFSVPAQGDGLHGAIRYHEASIRQILTELGYEAAPIEEGLAVVYGELAASNFSGVGISCGGGLCNICLAWRSVPVISFSVPKAGDFIDANDRGARQPVAHLEGKELQIERLYRRPGAQCADGLLPGGDRRPAWVVARPHHIRPETAEAGTIGATGAQRRHCDAQRLSGSLHEDPASRGISVAVVGGPGIRRPSACDGPRGADGRAVLGMAAELRLLKSPGRPCNNATSAPLTPQNLRDGFSNLVWIGI
jgi:hypothetical protein